MSLEELSDSAVFGVCSDTNQNVPLEYLTVSPIGDFEFEELVSRCGIGWSHSV